MEVTSKLDAGKRWLAYYDFHGEIRIDAQDYGDFKKHCLRERSSA